VVHGIQSALSGSQFQDSRSAGGCDKLYHLFEPPLPEGVLERLEKIVPYGKINRGNTILDVGSGTGILIPIIKKYGPRWIYACDLSVAMLEQLSSKKYPNVETIVADVRDLRLPGSSTDCR
jgi:predicted RNA methylase